MSKVAVVFWSGTGNTEEMAGEVLEGANLVCDSVICADAPDEEAKKACRDLGASLV